MVDFYGIVLYNVVVQSEVLTFAWKALVFISVVQTYGSFIKNLIDEHPVTCENHRASMRPVGLINPACVSRAACSNIQFLRRVNTQTLYNQKLALTTNIIVLHVVCCCKFWLQ